ncbi:hypothetical protein V8D89_008218 [Ganoderma adspersum]
MVGSEEGCANLYISVRPAASPELQALVRELLPHVQSLPGTPSTVLDVSKGGFDVGMLESLKPLITTPDYQLIIAVFRACHAKFRASVTGEGECWALLAALRKQAHSQPKFRGKLEKLSAKLDYLLKVTSGGIEQFSDVEVLGLYYTADDVLRSTKRMKEVLPTIVSSSAMKKLEVLPRAVRHILAGARKERELPHLLATILYSNIQWITSPAPQHFHASTYEDYIREQFGMVANDIVNYLPPKMLVEEAPRCFTGSAVMHPKAALLGYACEHKVDMSGYIGSSLLIC